MSAENPRPSFPITENSDGEGVAVSKTLDGDAKAGKNVLPAVTVETPGNTLTYHQQNASGELLVAVGGGGILRFKRDKLLKASADKDNFVEVVSKPLIASKNHCGLTFGIQSSKPLRAEIVSQDDSAGTPADIEILWDGLLEAGQYDTFVDVAGKAIEFISGSTGIPALVLRVKHEGGLSDVTAQVSTREV